MTQVRETVKRMQLFLYLEMVLFLETHCTDSQAFINSSLLPLKLRSTSMTQFQLQINSLDSDTGFFFFFLHSGENHCFLYIF